MSKTIEEGMSDNVAKLIREFAVDGHRLVSNHRLHHKPGDDEPRKHWFVKIEYKKAPGDCWNSLTDEMLAENMTAAVLYKIIHACKVSENRGVELGKKEALFSLFKHQCEILDIDANSAVRYILRKTS